MSLCSYSADTHSGSFLVIENTFIQDYLPEAPASCIKVYLYGLYLCTNPNSIENSVENLCHTLNMQIAEVKDAFEYWQAEGLVQLIENGTNQNNTLEVKYLPVSKRFGSSKKRQDKYTKFNSTLQSIVTGRMLTPTEYNEYYTLIESMRLEENALCAIAEYCVKLKGENVGYPYIVSVCKSFINQGLKTEELVKQKLSEHEEVTPELQDIIKAFGKKQAITVEDRNCYIKWTKDYGFAHGTIKEVAKTIKSKSPSITLLNSILESYYKLQLFSFKEISEYNECRNSYIALAKEIARTLGLRYDNYDTIVENYINDWVKKGYDEETLKVIAKYCLKASIRSMESMHNTILKFYKLGLVSSDSINQYIEGIVASDSLIQEVLDKCNLLRNVNSWDRDTYRTWSYTWKLSHEIIMLVADFSKDKAQPIQYMNKILSSMYEKNITQLPDAQEHLKQNNFASTTTSSTKKDTFTPSTQRVFKQSELDALFDNLDNIEIF